MATYDPPQPGWKRNLAAILDFVLAFFVGVYVASKIFGNPPDLPAVFGEPSAYFSFGDASFKVGGASALLALGLVIAYFVILGQTGGTVFQRLFGMKRVTFLR
jgi:hypothetical protein